MRARLRVPGGTPALLALACAVQLAIAAVIALTATHNHWVWYSGGDSTEYWTSGWSIAHGKLPQGLVGYGIPVLYSWMPFVAGTTLVDGLPLITVGQAVVLVLLATLLVFAIANQLFGRRFAWLAVWLWILGPLLMLWGFSGSYAASFRDLYLAPNWFGLTELADLPSLVAVLATTWAALRLFARPTIEDGLLAGLLLGVTLGIKPSNGFFLPGLALLVLATRNARAVAAVAGGAVLPLATLTLWKIKGRGFLPLTSLGRTREAVGAHPVVASAGHYVHFDSAHLGMILHDLSEVFWSVRVLEFLFFAGLIGALRRSPVKGAFLGLWCAGFLVLKGSSNLTSISSVSYWRYVEPGWPAFVLLAASIVFLLPGGGRRDESAVLPRALPGGRVTLAGAFAVAGLIPLVLVLAEPAATSPIYARDFVLGNDAPISQRLAVTAQRSDGSVELRWRAVHVPASSYYVIYRSDNGTTCGYPDRGAKECDLQMTAIAHTRQTSFSDRPGAGAHWYRIGLEANYRDALDGSDLMLVGPATQAG